MNTRFSYRYSDKTNCKQYTSIIIEGTITWDQIEPYLAKHGSFIPGQVGLEDLQHRFALAGADHPWHQIMPHDLKPTEDAPTMSLSASELAQRFATTTWSPNLRAATLNSLGGAPTATRVSTDLLNRVLPATPEDKQASRQWSSRSFEKKPTNRRKGS